MVQAYFTPSLLLLWSQKEVWWLLITVCGFPGMFFFFFFWLFAVRRWNPAAALGWVKTKIQRCRKRSASHAFSMRPPVVDSCFWLLPITCLDSLTPTWTQRTTWVNITQWALLCETPSPLQHNPAGFWRSTRLLSSLECTEKSSLENAPDSTLHVFWFLAVNQPVLNKIGWLILTRQDIQKG